MQIKTTLKFHLILIKNDYHQENKQMFVGCGKEEPLIFMIEHIQGSHQVNQCRHFSEYKKIELSFDPVVPLPGMHPEGFV